MELGFYVANLRKIKESTSQAKFKGLLPQTPKGALNSAI